MRYYLFFLVLLFLSCETSETQYSGEEVLQKSIQKHDPNGDWNKAEFALRIQEPRTQNPERFSEVYINNKNNSFSLKRNRGDKIATYSMNSNGITTVLLDDEIVQDTALIKEYLLQHNRVTRYQKFYQILLGLPMSLNDEVLKSIDQVLDVTFNSKKSYKVSVQLKEPMFSDHWNLFISEEDFTLMGIEMVFPDDPEKGERLYFEKSIQLKNFHIPRIRHWYNLKDEYAGSDVIVKKLN
jgi:hypothetical protein